MTHSLSFMVLGTLYLPGTIKTTRSDSNRIRHKPSNSPQVSHRHVGILLMAMLSCISAAPWINFAFSVGVGVGRTELAMCKSAYHVPVLCSGSLDSLLSPVTLREAETARVRALAPARVHAVYKVVCDYHQGVVQRYNVDPPFCGDASLRNDAINCEFERTTDEFRVVPYSSNIQ